VAVENNGFGAGSGWNHDLALQALTGFEPLFRDAVQAFATEIFSYALGWRLSRLCEQAQRPM